MLISPQGMSFEYVIPIKPTSTNNQTEYEAILKGIQLLHEVKAKSIEIFGDSQLVVNQLLGLYECKDDVLRKYYEECQELFNSFTSLIINHIPKNQNHEANRLAQSASGYRQIIEILADEVVADEDWRKDIIEYLKNPSKQVSRKLRCKALKFVLLDDQLYHRIVDGVLLKCLNQEEAKVLMGEIHEGVCGAHQSANKMKWMIRRASYFWPTMLENCFKYYKGCQECQKFGNIQKSLASAMNLIVKPWPFRGWAIDLIGQIFPSSSKGHKFVLVATDYFTK